MRAQPWQGPRQRLKALAIHEAHARAGQPKRGVTTLMNERKTLRLTTSDRDIGRAAELLQRGALVAFPTETVYGLGADARQGKAVAEIFEVKGRPSFNPLIVHVEDIAAARELGDFDETADHLAAAFWPGPLTLVVPLAEGHGLSALVAAGLPSVALRVPAHPTSQALLRATGRPLAAPSANPSGRISPTTSEHVLSGLGGKIAAVIDDGPCTVGLESTIVSTGSRPQMLREGGLPREAIEAALGGPLAAPAAQSITAPGQLTSHYAPRAAMRLNARDRQADEVMLGFGPVPGDETLSATGDLREAAARLFHCLHKLDATGRPIAVAPVPTNGIGAAINDRLQRAAAPRG